jgi:crotonobetainyl-CoA:carnitine CoA-transferase CaiB-like acyl-CoA transferase
MEHPTAGPMRMLGLPIEMSATPSSIRIPPPPLGADTEEVLTELGYTTTEIEGMRETGVV